MRLQTLRRETVLIVPLILAAAGAGARVYGQFTSGINLVEAYASVSDRHGEPLLAGSHTNIILAFTLDAYLLSVPVGGTRLRRTHALIDPPVQG